MFDEQEKQKNDDVIEKFREAFIIEAAWELHSGLEYNCSPPKARKHVKTATVIFNKAIGRTDYAGRLDLLVTVEDVKNKRQEVWGQVKKQVHVASDSEVLQK